MPDLRGAAWVHEALFDHLPERALEKTLLIALTWIVVLALTRASTHFFDLIDRRLTSYNVPERRLAKLDFFTDIFFVVMGILISLYILGIGQAIWGAVAVTSVAGIIIGLAAQQLAQNLLAGIMILLERPFTVGDTVEMDGRTGTIQKVTLHSTTLVTADGLQVLVPNSRVLNAPITNFSVRPERRIVQLLDILDAADLGRVEAVLRAAVATEEHLRRPAEVFVFVKESLDEGTRWEIRYWVDRLAFGDHCLPTAMRRLLDALTAAGIATAMPARHVYVQEKDGETDDRGVRGAAGGA